MQHSTADRHVSGRCVFARVTALCVLVAAAHSFMTPPAVAQEPTVLMIKVVDQTGGLLPKATVAVTHAGESRTIDPSPTPGVFLVGPLEPGTYVVRAEALGFAPATATATVTGPGLTEVTVELTVQIAEELSVSGVLGRNSLTGLTFTGKALEALPNSEIELLYRLLDLAGSRGRPGDVAIYVDGFRDFRRLPPKSVIEIIRINADPYSAEFSEPGTRRIEIITKPGAEDPYLELKFDFNDESLNATEALGNGKPPLQRRTVSGYYMAPIVRGKWGMYAYAGRWEQDEHAVIRATVLDANAEPAPFRETIRAPLRIHNFTANTTYAAGPQLRLKAEYSRDTIDAENQGLQQGGFSLPERALALHNASDIGRFSLLSILRDQALFELRVQLREDRAHTGAASRAPAVLVFDAFNGGGNQQALLKETATAVSQVDSKFTFVAGDHTVKTGWQIDRYSRTLRDETDFGGTFTFGADIERDATGAPIIDFIDGTFRLRLITPLENYRRTLAGAPGATASQFSITRGNPVSQLTQWELAGYAQGEWQQQPNLTVSYGVRYEAQTNLGDALNFAPRAGVAWAVGGPSGMLRAGAGIFHDRFDLALTDDTIRLDGTRLQRYVVERPTFFPDVQLPETVSPELQTVMRKAADVKAPEQLVANISYERDLLAGLFGSALLGSVSYTNESGRHLPRLRDVNAPLASGTPRPLAGLGQVLQYESSGRSRRHELQLALRASLGESSRIMTNYTFSSTRSDRETAQTLPADSYHLAGELGAALTDERHRVFLSGTIMLPRLWLLVPSLTIASARPFNITIGRDVNGDSHFTDRPAFAGAADTDAIPTRWGLLDPTPEPGDAIVPRNFGRGAALYRMDLALAKVFVVGSPALNRSVTFNLAIQNLLNRTNLLDFDGVLLSPVFGQANTAQPSRRISLGATLNF